MHRRDATTLADDGQPVRLAGKPTLLEHVAAAFRPGWPHAAVAAYVLLGWPMLRIRHGDVVCSIGHPCLPYWDEPTSLVDVAIRNAWADVAFNASGLLVGVVGSIAVAWLVVAVARSVRPMFERRFDER